MDQGNQIIQLIQVLISPTGLNQEIISQASNNLFQLYQKPETLFILLNLYIQATDITIKLFIATGIKNILSDKLKWEAYHQVEQSENIKGMLLQIILNEKNTHLFQNIIAAVKPILKTEYMVWPQYLELIQSFSQNQDNFYFSIIMANALIREIEEVGFLTNIWELFTNIAAQGLKLNNTAIIQETSKLIAGLFQFATTISTNLPELFSFLFQAFQRQMEINSPICGQIVDDFEEILDVPEFYFPNSIDIARQFLSLIMAESLNIDLRCLLISPVISLLFNDPSSDKNELINTIYEVIFVISSSSFIEDVCEEDQENMQICQQNLKTFLSLCDAKKVRQLILTKGAGKNTKGEVVTYGLSLVTFSEKYPELLIHDISSCLKFGFGCIQTNDHTIRETGYELLSTLFSRQNDAFLGIQNQFFTIAIQAFQVNHPPLILKVLECIYKYLEFVTPEKEITNNLFPILFQALKTFNHPSIQYKIIDCFTNLIKSLAEDVIPYSQSLMPIIAQAATQMNKPEECDVKASAVECLGMLIQYSSNLFPDITQALQIFASCIKSDENMLISAGFRSLTSIVLAKRPEVVQILPIAFEASLNIFNSVPEFIDDEERDNENNIMLDVWTFALEFISNVAKIIPDSIRANVGTFMTVFNKLINEDIDEEIESSVIETSSKLIKLLTPNEVIEFLRKLVQILIDTNEFKTASLCFHIIGKFIRKQQIYQLQIPPEIISVTCDLGLNSMKREMSFQDDLEELEFDVDFGTNLYIFFEEVARFATNLFPLNDFCNIAGTIFTRGVEFEQAEIISVLRIFYATAHESIPSIRKKLIVRQFVEKLPLCDCYNPPYPIAAVRTVVDIDPKQIEKYIPNIMQYIDETLPIEHQDQLAFRTTKEHIVSLLFSLFKGVFKENFEVQKYLQFMLAMMPFKTDATEAENAYLSLVFLCTEYANVFGHFSPEIIRILSQTFAMKERDWETIALPADVLHAMAFLLQNLLNSMQQGNEILATYVPDPIARQRFQQRFTSYLQNA